MIQSLTLNKIANLFSWILFICENSFGLRLFLLSYTLFYSYLSSNFGFITFSLLIQHILQFFFLLVNRMASTAHRLHHGNYSLTVFVSILNTTKKGLRANFCCRQPRYKVKNWCTDFDVAKIGNNMPHSVYQICLLMETYESHLSMQKVENRMLLDRIKMLEEKLEEYIVCRNCNIVARL